MNGLMIAKRSLASLLSRSQKLFGERQIHFNQVNEDIWYRAMHERIPLSQGFLFRQLFDEKSWTYSYLLACSDTQEAVIIDPGKIK